MTKQSQHLVGGDSEGAPKKLNALETGVQQLVQATTVPDYVTRVKQGGFYGVPDFAGGGVKPTLRENPLCWFPKDVDNSNGGQMWITGERFGPLSGQMLHSSYGTCTLFSVLKEEVNGQIQGGVVPLPLA